MQYKKVIVKDPGTWIPVDEDMVSVDTIEFPLEEESYKDHIDSYQRKTGLTEAVQTGTGQELTSMGRFGTSMSALRHLGL